MQVCFRRVFYNLLVSVSTSPSMFEHTPCMNNNPLLHDITLTNFKCTLYYVRHWTTISSNKAYHSRFRHFLTDTPEWQMNVWQLLPVPQYLLESAIMKSMHWLIWLYYKSFLHIFGHLYDMGADGHNKQQWKQLTRPLPVPSLCNSHTCIAL